MAALQTDAEYRRLTQACGLVDRSERGKLALTGAGAVEFLNGQVTNELADLHPGEGCYAAFLTHKGKMLGDVRILAVGMGELLLDTERVALQALFDMIRRFKVGYDVQLHKRTLECSLLSLIGPSSREVAARAAGIGAYTLAQAEHAHLAAEIAARPVRLIAAAAQGVDVLCDAGDREQILLALQAAGAEVVDEQAAEIVRVERGIPRYGIDIDESTIPQEAGLNERAVSFTKGCYVGQETVARLHYRGKPNRHLRGLLLSGVAAAGAELSLGERTVGHLGSVVSSPRYGPIALALVRREAQPGALVTVGRSATSQGATSRSATSQGATSQGATSQDGTSPDRANPDSAVTATIVELPFAAERERVADAHAANGAHASAAHPKA
jgi:folate-binding protein YgfZ